LGGFGYAGQPGPAGPGTAAPADADEDDDLIVAVMEVDDKTSTVRKKFAQGGPVSFTHRWGKIMLVNKATNYEVMVLERSKGVAVPTAASRFKAKLTELFKDKPNPEDVVREARWALEHGLTDECAQVLDKLAETDKSHTAVAAYLKVKADLARPAGGEATAGKIRNALPGYKMTEDDKGHYALVHPPALDDAGPYLKRLELSFRNYYYWWALPASPCPCRRSARWPSSPARRTTSPSCAST